jgi:hypothetical protein
MIAYPYRILPLIIAIALMNASVMMLSGCANARSSDASASSQPAPSPMQLVPVIFAVMNPKGGFGGEWYGKLDRKDFDSYMQGRINGRLLVFYEVYYVDESGRKISNGKTADREGRPLGYSDTVAIRSEGIFRLMAGFTIRDDQGTEIIMYNPGVYDEIRN